MALAVVIAGGGTGGHIFPALALAEAIRKREPGATLCFVGTERGLETRYVPAAGIRLETVPSRQWLGRGPLAQVGALGAALRGVWRARGLLRELDADLVLGVGGYASVPAVAAAHTLRLPTALLEPNAHPGRANRLLGRLARQVFVQFEDARRFFPEGRTQLTGLPVRAFPPRVAGRRDGPVHVVVAGGSQGARSINRAFTAALPQLRAASALHITHQTGPRDVDEARAAYRAAGVDPGEAEVEAFFEDLPARYAAADIVVARAGAGTCAELCAAATAAILVPYPYAADDHQQANADELARAGACRVIRDAELGERLAPELLGLIAEPERRAVLAAAAGLRARPNAADEIWSACRAWLRAGDEA